MTSNLKLSLRSLRLGLALIFTLFLAVASWAADVTYTYTCVKATNGATYYIQSSNGDVQVALGGNQGNQWQKDKAISFANDYISISPNQNLIADYDVLNLPGDPTTTQFTVSSTKWYIKKVTINVTDNRNQAQSKSATNHEAKTSLIAFFSWNSTAKAKLVSIVVELTDQPYYTVKPADGLQISNTANACLVRSDINGNPLYYFHPNDNISIEPTSAVQFITAVTTPTTGATIASDKRSFSFAMPSQAITPSATLVEAHPLTFSGNVSISEPFFTYDGDNYYKSGDLITVTTTKTNEIIDGITGIADYTIADDKKSATFTMPTSDLTLAVTTSEVHTMSVPSGMTSDPYITIGDVKYYKKGETYTLTAPQYNIIDGFTATGAQSSSVSSDKRSATVTIGSANVTTTASLTEVHTMSVPSGMTLSDPYITINEVKYYKSGDTYTFTAPTYNIIESFTATGAQSCSISADKRTAKVTVGTANVTTTASLTEVHTLSVPEGMTLSAPYTTIDNVKYYKRGETYTFTAPEYNIIESFTATMAEDKSVSSDRRSATVTIGKSDVNPIAELTEVHTVTAQDGITQSEAYTNILGTDYYKYGQEVTFGFSGSGSVAYFVNGERIEGNSVTLGHENLTVQMGVPYIDENGEKQVRKPGDFTVLASTTDVSDLPGGWYVVLGEVSYTSQVTFSGDAYLILADGAKMEIETVGFSRNGIRAAGNLKIYGQINQRGILKASAKNVFNHGINGRGNITISGGTVTATSEQGSGIYGYEGVTINGGTVSATSEQSSGITGIGNITISGGTVTATSEQSSGISGGGNITISGGNVTATGDSYGISSINVTISGGSVTASGNYGIYGKKGIILSWTKITDAVKASSYQLGDSEKHVIIADGKFFTDEDDNVYSGTLNSDQLSAIKGKTLTPASIKYIDENGEEKSIYDYTVLTSTTDVSNLPGGWYVVQGEVSYTNTVTFSGDAYLILADGAKIEIETDGESEHGIYASKNLTIYGQGGQRGILKTTVKGSGGRGIYSNFGNVTISGGSVSATGNDYGIFSYKGVTISGGTVTATSENSDGIYSSSGNVTISGGTVTATGKFYGIYGKKGIILSWTKITDAVKASCLVSSDGNVIIADGKSFVDEDGNVYSGTLNSAQLFAIKGKTLTPVPPTPVHYVDENGNEKSIYEYTVLTAEMAANELPGGWYVLENSDPNYTDLYLKSTLSFSGDVNLILADGADMGVSVEKGDAINVAGKLTIYGQSNQTGELYASGSENGINAEKGIVVNGGRVKAYGSGEYKYGFNGGENGVDIHLKHYNSYIIGSSYREPVTVSGLALHGHVNNGIYEGDLDKAQIENMAYQYQLLEPCYVVKFDKDNNTDPEFLAATFNKEGVAHVARPDKPTREGLVFYGWFTLTGPDPTDKNSYTRFRFDEPVTANTEVIAIWEEEIRVMFRMDDGKIPEETFIVVAEYDENGDAYVAKPEVPTREGYTFLEWVDKAKADSNKTGDIRNRFRFDEPVTQSTYAYAKWWKNDPVEYVAYDPDEGKVVTKTVKDYTVLTPWTDVSKGLPAEWYIVVDGNKDEDDDDGVDLRFTKQLNFNSETTHIILMDGAQMIVGDDMNSAIHANVLNIYGQSIGSGNLTVNSDSWAIEAGSFNIYGGILHAFGKLVGIYSYNTAHLYGGFVEVANGNYGIYVNKGDIILDWSNKYFDGYNINGYATFNGGSVIVANGKYFKDEKGHIYGGMLSSNQIMAISQQTIWALPWKNVGDYAAVQIFEDGNGKKHAVIDGDYELGEAVKIPEPVAVDDIEFVRDFDANTPSTVLLPFSLPSCATVNAKFYTLDNVSQSGNRWVATVASIGNALPEANTAYAVMLPTDGRLEFNFDGCATAEKKQAIFQATGHVETSGNADGSWYFTGTYEFIQWGNPNYIDAVGDGLIYGFAGSNEYGIAKGQFGRVDYSAEINPLRCYLRKKSKNVKLQPQTLAKAAPQVLKAAPGASYANAYSSNSDYSISLLPETIDVKFVDKDENGEHTTAIGRMDPRTGKIRLLRTDRTYDLKGRRVNNVNRAAKGAYYGKKL